LAVAAHPATACGDAGARRAVLRVIASPVGVADDGARALERAKGRRQWVQWVTGGSDGGAMRAARRTARDNDDGDDGLFIRRRRRG
jgi:predicted Rossmann-fold nucleotide-binding protein